ncbi:hypothetical protein HYV49_01985 [Candidatus Pacearchaeota archaeon]|nr:hypothetical protein [Candidatus Pacearchaeota archaeon]
MDKTVVILLVILILAVVVFGINSLRNDNSDKISGAAVAPQSVPSQYGGGGCGR